MSQSPRPAPDRARISLATPFGRLALWATDTAITRLAWSEDDTERSSPLLERARAQILAYLDKRAVTFDLPLAPAGPNFQQAVWRAMLDIPYGHTRSYGALADICGGSAQAIGGACGANPIPLLIPCHRVVAAGGKLGGFSGGKGAETKRLLLQFEGALEPSLF